MYPVGYVFPSSGFAKLADASTTGVLSGADWTTFNNKQDALPAPMNYLGDWTVVGTSSYFEGQVAGMTTDVFIGADNVGVLTNNILLTGDGFSDINSLILAWNTGHPTNHATLGSGDGSQVPDDQAAIQLAGALAPNTPTLIYGTGTVGDVYRVSGSATIDLGGGDEDWFFGDWVVYDEDGQWQKVNHTNAVTSVNGQDGSVVLAMQNAIMRTKLSGSAQPYTPTTGCIFFIVEMIGGGGGGSGGGTTTSGGDGADGTDTTFAKGGGPSLTAGKGFKGTSSVMGAGGTASISGTAGTPYSVSGSRGQWGDGQGVLVGLRGVGGIGGVSPFGGMGSSGSNSNAVDSLANSGAGGCGGGMITALAGNCGNGGGSGAYIKAVITDVAGLYTYTVGGGGAGGSAGTSGTTGGAGGSGVIIITEFFDFA